MAVVLVGIDSGGSRTTIGLESDAHPDWRRTYGVTPSLSGAIEPALYPSVLSSIFASIDEYLPLDLPPDAAIYVFISAAAYSPWARDELLGAVKAVAPRAGGGRVAAVGIANDSSTLLLGFETDAIVIAGTGSNVLARSAAGQPIQVGGQEWVACDNGSGFWIGLRGIRQAFLDFEDGAASALLAKLRTTYGTEPDYEVNVYGLARQLAIIDQGMKKRIARFAKGVCDAAVDGDPTAEGIVRVEAEGLADRTVAALDRAAGLGGVDRPIRVVECGGLLGNEFYRALFEARVRQGLAERWSRDVTVTWRLVSSGVDAALNLARKIQLSAPDILTVEPSYAPAVVTLR